MRKLQLIGFVSLILMLAGCASGAVQFAATPPPPDHSPLTYTHASGAFSLAVPRTWSNYTQNVTTLAGAAFTPPDASEPLVRVGVIDIGQEISPDAFRTLMFDYQTNFRSDIHQYTEQDRQEMADGSWRITGAWRIAEGKTQQLNTFFQRAGTLFSVMDVIVPADAVLRSQVQQIANSFVLNSTSELSVAPLNTLSSLAFAQLELVNVSVWTTPDRVFYLTGEIANRSGQAVGNIPIRAALWSADGAGLDEAVDVEMGYSIQPGGYAPFSLRFGKGLSPQVDYYTLTLGGENWQPSEPVEVLGGDSMAWTFETSYNENGHLIVSGTVTNTSSRPVYDARAVVTVFDAEQRVVAAGYAPVDEAVLQPEESANYVVLMPDRGGPAVNFMINVQGLAEPPQ